MDGDALGRAKAAWASLAEVPRLRALQVVVRARSRLSPPGWVGVVVVDDTVTVSVPHLALKSLLENALGDLQPWQAASPAVLLDRLPPVSAVLGPAALFYPLGPVAAATGAHAVTRASVDSLATLMKAVSREELDESGVSGLTGPVFVARSPLGLPLAACGYRPWPGNIAHMCVLTHPSYRRAGLGVAVARAALRDALAEGRLPQWRARLEPSKALARKLGLVQVGAQLSFRVEP